MSPASTEPSQRVGPIHDYIAAAQRAGVSQDAAWSMWRVVFPRATRRIFRAVWVGLSP